MSKSKNKSSRGTSIRFALLGLIGLAVLMAVLLRGHDVALFSPKGLIAADQHRLMVMATVIMLGIAIPTLAALYWFAWRYREGSKRAIVNHRSGNSKFIALLFWAMPGVVVLMLASLMLPATQRLAPQKLIAAANEPLNIQVVALRWKWLFIYPQQNIATVNYVQIPIDTPVEFNLTADEAPMNSFWIPHLGGQLYAMTGHDNRLNLMAATPGVYTGSAAEINGAGFAGMRFTTHASSNEDFEQWVQQVQQYPGVLDSAAYNTLLMPSANNQAAFYSGVQANLYDAVLHKYAGSHHHAGYQ